MRGFPEQGECSSQGVYEITCHSRLSMWCADEGYSMHELPDHMYIMVCELRNLHVSFVILMGLKNLFSKFF